MLTIIAALRVKSRLFLHSLIEQFGLFVAPLLQCLKGRLMLQSALRDEVVVGRQVMGQCGVELGCRCEPGLVDDVADAAVEALDHAVGLRMPGRAQAVLDAQRYAGKVEYMLTRRSFGLLVKRSVN